MPGGDRAGTDGPGPTRGGEEHQVHESDHPGRGNGTPVQPGRGGERADRGNPVRRDPLCQNEPVRGVTDPRHICAVIPTFNNGGTVSDVVRGVLRQGLPVLVVDDGSTDDTQVKLKDLDIRVLRHETNRGKGRALKTGLEAARKLGYRFAVTLDADGQHDPADIPALVAAAGERTLVIGSRNLTAEGMPSGNTFANKFSNFWFTVQTGRKLPDTQTGFRVYPLEDLPSLKLLTARYEAELALLVFSAWKNLRIVPVPVRVYYPEDRVSHFRPFADFFRISVLNTLLCVLALVYGYPRMLIGR
ncbi:MAG: glycosyltransferase family 2 protein [Bacteroidales bacterium]|nr:glycosyltransferase family 2 protein [Bacteroidales bacterium]